MQKALWYLFILILASVALSGCDKDNTPLPTPLAKMAPDLIQVQTLWQRKVGAGSGHSYLLLNSATDGTVVVTPDDTGKVTALDLSLGKILWQVSLRLPLSSTPAMNATAVFLGTLDGRLVALNKMTGAVLWQAELPSAILSAPAVTADVVVALCHNSDVVALDAQTGKQLWVYDGETPSLSLERNSSPMITDQGVVVGFANGQLGLFDLTSGQTKWLQPVSLPSGSNAVMNMVDVDGTPEVDNETIYVISYHGNAAAFNSANGAVRWEHPESSFETPVIANGKLIVTTDQGVIKALSETTGASLWQQDALRYRFVSAPNVVGNSVVVGDYQGYVHFLSLQDGRLLARLKVSSGAINTQPLIVNNQQILITSSDGTITLLSPAT